MSLSPGGRADALVSLDAYDFELLWQEFLVSYVPTNLANKDCIGCHFCEGCVKCFRCSFCKDCTDCAFCTWQTNKQYLVFNEIQLSKRQWCQFRRRIIPYVKAFKASLKKYDT